MNIKEGSHPGRKNPLGSCFIFILFCLMIGFIAGEIMGSALVARENSNLLVQQQWLEKMGYIAVPGTVLCSEIKSLKTYFAGGLFFALSLGLCYAFTWGILIWGLMPWPKIRISASVILFWMVIFLYLTTPGWTRFWAFGLFLIIVPILIHFGYLKIRLRINRKISLSKVFPAFIGFLGAILMIYFFITPSLTSKDFVRIRDGFLGRTKRGREISDFYYRYTLYPARVIKNFDQRLQRFLRIEPDTFMKRDLRRLRHMFLWRDIFIGKDAPSHALLKQNHNHDKIFMISEIPRFTITEDVKALFNDPDEILEDYKNKSDSAIFLRKAVRWSLFQIWPFMGLFLLYGFFLFICDLFYITSVPPRNAILAFLCVIILIIGLRSLIKPNHASMDTEAILNRLEGKDPGEKITAVMVLWERIEKDKSKAQEFSKYFMEMLQDPDPIIRKWGIDFLILADEKKAVKSLIDLLKDPDSHLAYHAARGLGKHRAREARQPLLDVLYGPGSWYVKSEAYNALRRIGWSQMSLTKPKIEKQFP